MDLKIKDVAELLSVSEATIEQWLKEGKIPGYSLNRQYRFDRQEIENWMIHCKPQTELPSSGEHICERGGTQQFLFYRSLNQGDVLDDMPGATKEELIVATTHRIAPLLGVDGQVLSELLLDREALMPTALSRGIAVPHARDFLVKGAIDRVVVVYPEVPIPYGALDGEPVHTLFFLFAGSDKNHLGLLAKIAHLCSQNSSLELLRSKPDKKRLLHYIRDWEPNAHAS